MTKKNRKFRDRWDDFTPSLLQFPLDIWKPGGSSHMKRQGCSSENLNLTPKEDSCGRCLNFIRPLKDTT